MVSISVEVQRDHIEALVHTKRPLLSVAELIWNGFDADATRVQVRLGRNGLGELESISVSDNGSGIRYEEAPGLFGKLGGSWKAAKRRTPHGRSLHGKFGKGRFRAFGLGSLVSWNTTGLHQTTPVNFSIVGRREGLDRFDLSEPAPAHDGVRGTEVVVSNLDRNFTSLNPDSAVNELAKLFAIYLTEYPEVELEYQGERVDPKSVQLDVQEYSLDEVVAPLLNGNRSPVNLTVVEWKVPTDRALYFCDGRGVALHQVAPGVQAPGFNFTAYLKSDFLRDLDKEGLLALSDLHATASSLASTAKVRIREHFRRRLAEQSAALVQGWRDAHIYPYEGEPSDPLDAAERQVFDVVAVNVNAYLADFEHASDNSKRFTFTLLKQSLKENPTSLQRIFSDVLNLPKAKQDEFAEMLNKTSLLAILSVAKLVTDRLDFLRGLEALVFDQQTKGVLLERDQLHKILANETWIFGENFHLTHNESTLDEVLDKHLERLGTRRDDASPVLREDGKQGRVDLMLSRKVPQPKAEEAEYLVIELKRPSRRIDSEVLNQVESYAIAVAKDERFLDTKTKWIFWAISNEMTEEARIRAKQGGRPEGLYFDYPELKIQAWAKTWGQLIRECRGRLEYLRAELNYEADRETARTYLSQTHAKYVPDVGLGEEVTSESSDQLLVVVPDGTRPTG